MNIREAILKAADSIEAHPKRFDFDSILIPGLTCGSPGCALGWIGAHLGLPENETITNTYRALGFAGAPEFYQRMDITQGWVDRERNWINSAAGCAETLRKYADKYHSAETPKHVGIPASVRAIFDVEPNSVSA